MESSVKTHGKTFAKHSKTFAKHGKTFAKPAFAVALFHAVVLYWGQYPNLTISLTP